MVISTNSWKEYFTSEKLKRLSQVQIHHLMISWKVYLHFFSHFITEHYTTQKLDQLKDTYDLIDNFLPASSLPKSVLILKIASRTYFLGIYKHLVLQQIVLKNLKHSRVWGKKGLRWAMTSCYKTTIYTEYKPTPQILPYKLGKLSGLNISRGRRCSSNW